MKTTWFVALVLCCVGETVLACIPGCTPQGSPPPPPITGEDIARTAEAEVNSTLWGFYSSHRTGKGTEKCNIFVAEMIERAGGSVPHRHCYCWSPIGAGEWANPDSTYLTGSSHWIRVETPQRGDVVGLNGHVGIYVGANTTVSASAITNTVVRNNWGFHPGDKPTFWRYVP